MASKQAFANQCQQLATELGQISAKLPGLEKCYFARGYNSGGSNPIATDPDLTTQGITAGQLSDFIGLIQQLQKFFGNVAVTQGDYQTNVEVMRTDH